MLRSSFLHNGGDSCTGEGAYSYGATGSQNTILVPCRYFSVFLFIFYFTQLINQQIFGDTHGISYHLTQIINLLFIIISPHLFMFKQVQNSLDPWEKSSWVYNPNLVKIVVALMSRVMIQSGHNFAHAMTAQLSCHGMCKIVNWLDHYYSYENNVYLYRIWIMSS